MTPVPHLSFTGYSGCAGARAYTEYHIVPTAVHTRAIDVVVGYKSVCTFDDSLVFTVCSRSEDRAPDRIDHRRGGARVPLAACLCACVHSPPVFDGHSPVRSIDAGGDGKHRAHKLMGRGTAFQPDLRPRPMLKPASLAVAPPEQSARKSHAHAYPCGLGVHPAPTLAAVYPSKCLYISIGLNALGDAAHASSPQPPSPPSHPAAVGFAPSDRSRSGAPPRVPLTRRGGVVAPDEGRWIEGGRCQRSQGPHA
jgi:hypothetical protein